MKILLLSPPKADKWLQVNARCDFSSWSGCQWWPLILGHLGAYLEGEGHEVKLLDAQSSEISESNTQKIVVDYNADYSVILTSRDSLQGDLAWAIYLRDRKEGARSCFVSPFFFDPQARRISEEMKMDFVAGEPEKGVSEWLGGREGFIKGDPLTEEEYRAIPWATMFMAKHCEYKAYMAPSEPFPFIDLMTGRGCSYGKCTFCLWPKTYRQKYLTRDIDDVMNELKWIERQGIFKGVMIEDDNFPDWRALDFASRKIQRGVKIPWSCLTRAELKEETMKVMKESGCLNLHIGFESGCDKTLQRIKKGLHVAEMEKFVEAAHRVGLKIHGDFMIGIDETEAEIYQTIEFACRLGIQTAQFQIYIPYVGDRQFHDPEHLRELAVMAYKRFYGDPRNWPSVLKQFGKPRVIGRSLQKLIGG